MRDGSRHGPVMGPSHRRLVPQPAQSVHDRPAVWSDGLLDLGVVAFAAWTLAYQLCLLLHLGAGWAAGGAAVAFSASLPLLLAQRRPASPGGSSLRRPPSGRLRGLVVVAAAVAAACVAFLHAAWPVAVGAWLMAGALGAFAGRGRPWSPARGGAGVVLVLGLALAVLASLLLNPNVDDTNYVHLAAWVAAHGTFPGRDTLFSDQALPALFFPPLNSYEALLGTIARLTGVSAPDVVYLGVPPLAAILSTLALWRLLRSWGARAPAVALCVAVAFLLFDAGGMRELGGFWLARIWQGKAIFVSVLVPLLFALLHEYAREPTRRRLALLAAAGVAGVGLTTTAMFVVPVVAVGTLGPVLLSGRRRVAAAALAATLGYPLAAALFTLAVGGRNPQAYSDAEMVPATLVHDVLGYGPLAFVAFLAALTAPVLIADATAARMIAGIVLIVGVLFLPGLTLTIFHLTGLGEVLWRLTWALPMPALVGLLAVEAVGRVPWRAARALAPVAIAATVVLWGTPVWSRAAGTGVATTPRWKLPPADVSAAREALADARPGDVVLAPHRVSQAILDVSGDVVVVDPLDRYAHFLGSGGDVAQRLLLEQLVGGGLAPLERARGRLAAEREVRVALRRLHVAVACVPVAEQRAWRVLRGDQFVPVAAGGGLRCLRLPASRRSQRTLARAGGGERARVLPTGQSHGGPVASVRRWAVSRAPRWPSASTAPVTAATASNR